MKELPADPKPWRPPPERWFDRHEHTPETSDIRTLTAMRLIVYDRVGLGTPADKWVVTPVETELLRKCLWLYPDGDDLMKVWRDRCSALRQLAHGESAVPVYINLLALIAKGQ